jgi:hypothetical protein
MVTTWPDEFERARQLIDDAVQKHITEWASIVGLPPTGPRIDEFRDDVTKALHACMRAHIAGSARKKVGKNLRKVFHARYLKRKVAIEKLRGAFTPIFPPSYHEFQVWEDLKPFELKLEALTEAMRLQANDSTSTGGRPSPMQPFKLLTNGLVHAYKRSTENSGVGYGARKGKLLAFVETVLPVTRKIAEAVTGRPLVTSKSVGEYLHRVALAESEDITPNENFARLCPLKRPPFARHLIASPRNAMDHDDEHYEYGTFPRRALGQRRSEAADDHGQNHLLADRIGGDDGLGADSGRQARGSSRRRPHPGQVCLGRGPAFA